MRFATLMIEGQPVVVAKDGDGPIRTLIDVKNMIQAIGIGRAEAEARYRAGHVVEGTPRFLAPIPQPGKIVAIGRNYMDHVREQNETPPAKPLIFAKLPSSVIGPDAVIQWDATDTAEVDYEAELAVVIGRETRLVTPESALGSVFGYTIANDVTARDLQRTEGQWTRAKGLDTFCPMGPWLVAADEIPDPQNVAIRLTVNGETRQDSNTREMIFDVKTLIAYASRAFTLMPGDVILTGTPAGVGSFRKPPTLLRDGDLVTIEIAPIGKLSNRCRQLTFRAR